MANGSREEAQKNYGKIVEDTDKLVHFRLPPKLNKLFSGDLSEGKIKWGGPTHEGTFIDCTGTACQPCCS